MARLLLLVLALIGFALTFIAKSPGLLGIGLLFGIVGLFGFVFALAAARVSASARPEASMASVEDIVALRKRPAAPRSSASASVSDPSDRAH
jgi:hypothetical protein